MTAVALFLGLTLCLAACGGGGSTDLSVDTTSTTAPSGSSSDPSANPPTRTQPSPPPAPKVGECRKLSYGDVSLYSNDVRTVPCSKKHTAYTFHVADLPQDVAFDGVQIKNDAVQKAAAKACQGSYRRFIGGSAGERALARLTVTYFLPEQRGFDAGAHWVRCDIIALKSDRSLAPLPANLESFLDGGDALKDFGVCSRGDPSTPQATLVMCTQSHTYRAVTAIKLGGVDAPYPGEAEALSSGKQKCEAYIKQLLGVGGGFTYSWTYPSADDWKGGQRFGYCWNQSSS